MTTKTLGLVLCLLTLAAGCERLGVHFSEGDAGEEAGAGGACSGMCGDGGAEADALYDSQGTQPGDPCDDAGGRFDKGGACCHKCLDAAHGWLCGACDDAGDGGPGIVTVCGSSPMCPTGYTGVWFGAMPDECGGVDCKMPGFGEVCAPLGHNIGESCDLALACSGGRQLQATIATCDCPNGLLYVCWI